MSRGTGQRKAYDYVIDKLAVQLQGHIQALEEVRKYISLYDATRGSSASKEALEESLRNLRDLRRGIIENMQYLKANVNAASREALEDAEALIAYYLEAAYKSEVRVLEEVKGKLECDDDLKELSELEKLARSILDALKGLLQ